MELRNLNNGTITMQLVGKGVDPLEGENGYAPTTWISKEVLQQLSYRMNQYGTGLPRMRWETNEARAGLMGEFYTNNFPLDLAPYLRRVIKYTRSFMDDSSVVSDYPTIDWIWVPSAKEVFGPAEIGSKETLGPFYDGMFGTNGEPDAEKRLKINIVNGAIIRWITRTFYSGSPLVYALNYIGIQANGSSIDYSDQTVRYPIGFCL